MKVDWVIIHHEGGGAPKNEPASPLYSVWIGLSTYTIQHGPEDDGATAGLNGEVLSVCFSGNRHQVEGGPKAYAITDPDLARLRAAMAACRKLGYVTDNPKVTFHGDDELHDEGNATACPGNLTYARRPEVEAACRALVLPRLIEDEMYIAATPSKPTWLIGAGKPIQLDAASVTAFQNAGVKVVPVTALVNDRINANTK